MASKLKVFNWYDFRGQNIYINRKLTSKCQSLIRVKPHRSKQGLFYIMLFKLWHNFLNIKTNEDLN